MNASVQPIYTGSSSFWKGKKYLSSERSVLKILESITTS